MQATGLTTTDLIIAIVYVFGIIGIGIYFSKQHKSPKDFLLAGRSMGWLPVGLSLMATLTSAVGYMSFPAGAFKGGLILLWMAMAIPLSFPVVVYVFMPFYHKLRVYTAYEYLERRFNDKVRALTSIIFILWRVTWMAAVIYVPSYVLTTVSDGAIPLVPSIIVLGLIATANTTMGGIKAVMWGDVVHSTVMFASMIIAIILVISAVPGGFTEIWDTLTAAGKTKMTGTMPGFEEASLWGQIKLYLITDFTVLSLIITYTVQKMGNYCVDQAMVQRYLTARSLSQSQKGFAANAGAYLLYVFLVTTIGAGLFAVTKHFVFPEALKVDQIFPYFIANFMPIGLTGVMVAAIYGASLSSFDSGINSCATAILNDFYGRYKLKIYNLESGNISAEEHKRRLKIARISTVIIGLLVTFLALFVGFLGDIFIYSQKLINMFTGPLFGVFVLAMFTKRATAPAVLIAGFIGFVMGSLMVFAKKWGIDELAVGVLWPAAISFVITVVLGYLLSYVLGENTDESHNYTRSAVMANEKLNGITK
ncbi:sodium/solute symporter [Bacteroidota bacterium]